MLSHKMDFNCCANRDGFRIDSHILLTLGDVLNDIAIRYIVVSISIFISVKAMYR